MHQLTLYSYSMRGELISEVKGKKESRCGVGEIDGVQRGENQTSFQAPERLLRKASKLVSILG